MILMTSHFHARGHRTLIIMLQTSSHILELLSRFTGLKSPGTNISVFEEQTPASAPLHTLFLLPRFEGTILYIYQVSVKFLLSETSVSTLCFLLLLFLDSGLSCLFLSQFVILYELYILILLLYIFP